MSDDIRVDQVGGTEIHEPPRTSRDPGRARDQIEATRARISGTIDEIEDALLQKKERIQDRLDVMEPVRERPLPMLGIALGMGLTLGLLTGHGDRERRDDDSLIDARDSAALWERRAHHLLRIARNQESEIEMLHRRRAMARRRDHIADTGDESSMLERTRDFVADRLSGRMADSVSRLRQRVSRA